VEVPKSRNGLGQPELVRRLRRHHNVRGRRSAAGFSGDGGAGTSAHRPDNATSSGVRVKAK
jgi:hypothetical protein